MTRKFICEIHPAFCSDGSGSFNVSNDAAFIVRACNAHDDLLAALREIEQVADAPRNSEEDFANIASFARAAIAKAEA